MQEFKGKVAVVTGAASGIGRALAQKCANEGMKLVLADIEAEPLARAAQELKDMGAEVITVPTDVSKAADIEQLAQQSYDSFGAVHLLFNNAGVGGTAGTIWENTTADWEWVLGVNTWSVIHGVRVFVPRMLAQNSEGHIVNTASIAGLISYPGSSTYQVSKHAVVAISEALYYELALKKAKIQVSVLCPAWVNTRIFESDRNRPAELQNEPEQATAPDPDTTKIVEGFRYAVQHGKPPQQIAELVFEAIRGGKFYIITHSKSKKQIESRMEDILQERNPTNSLS